MARNLNSLKNLGKPFTSDQDHDTCVANGRKGGKASARNNRLRKTGRELIREALAMKVNDPVVIKSICDCFGVREKDLSHELAMTLRQIEKAEKKGDTFAYQQVMKAAGILDDNAGGQQVGLQINVGTQEAADGLRIALENGGQPRPPEDDEDDE